MDSIDVSIGLSSTLQRLERYYESGIVQARMPYLPGLRGAGVAVIEVVSGKIVACFIQNGKGDCLPLVPDILTHFDMSRGPFEWTFYPNMPQERVTAPLATQKPPVSPRPRLPAGHDVPQIIASLNVSILTGFSPQQRRALRMTYAMVNGRRTLGDIEAHVLLPRGAVYEAAEVLVMMRVIVIHFL